MKMIKLAGLVILFTGLYVSSNDVSGQYFNYERFLGKENPYFSIVKGDSIMMYQKTDSAILLLDKVQTQEKILKDLRVINRNQTTLEIWLFISILLNLICIILIVRLMLKR